MSLKINRLGLCALFLLLPGLVFGRAIERGDTPEVVPNRLIVGLKRDASPAVASAIAPGARVRRIGRLNLHVIDLPDGSADAQVEKFAANPAVAYVERDRVRHSTLAAPNDVKYVSQWALQTVKALDAWGLLPGRYDLVHGSRLKVAVLDSGADCTHPDFRNAGGTSTDAAQGGQFDYQSSKAMVATTISGPACAWQDDFGHGTHTAGIIAAAANNGQGVAGLAYPVQLAIYKVLDSNGKGPDSGIAAAIMAAADAGAAVISMSLGETGYSQTLQNAVNYAWERDVLVVAAAGNDNTNALFFPAAANHVLAVSAVDASGAKAAFSNHGTYVGIAAPGVNILSTVPTYPVTQKLQNYAFYSGTSMAAPFVSAAGGLVAMMTPGLAADAIALRLQQSAAPAGAAGWNEQFGYGILDANRALNGQLRQSATGGLAGQVVNASGYPVAGARVYVDGVSAITDFTGLFRIANQAAGSHTVQVSFGGATQTFNAVVPPGGDSRLTIATGTNTGTVSGFITSDGVPVANAVVQAVAGGLVKAAALTNEAGQYWLTVGAGTYDVRASAVSHGPAVASSIKVSAGASQNASLALSRMGSIAGTLLDGAGRPVAGAQISISGGSESGAVTSADGTFSTLGLPAGTYSAAATVGGKSIRLDGIWVPMDYTARVALDLGGHAANLEPDKPPAFTPVRVNAGGFAYTDAQGNNWTADMNFAGGGHNTTVAPIQQTATPDLYKSERFGIFMYRFSVSNGNYFVRLKFAEIFFDEPRKRIFGIALNGQPVLSQFDVFAAAGGKNIAIDRQFPVYVTGGQIVIEALPLVENPKISAIEIVPAASSTQNTKAAHK